MLLISTFKNDILLIFLFKYNQYDHADNHCNDKFINKFVIDIFVITYVILSFFIFFGLNFIFSFMMNDAFINKLHIH